MPVVKFIERLDLNQNISFLENTFTNNTQEPNSTMKLSTATFGYCKKCAKVHKLSPGKSIHACRELMKDFSSNPADNLVAMHEKTREPFALSELFGPSRGKMFGVMECLHPDDSITYIKAFSGQLNGIWQVEGWAPPIFDIKQYESTSYDTEKEIKALGRKIDQYTPHSKDWLMLKKLRRNLSQQLMYKIHNLYRLTNFKGETVPLHEAYNGRGGIPAGTGDCCAPKLLNFAARHNLRPTGISEFYWGKENKAATRQHGSFYSSCPEKCQPILGFLLCGLND